MMKISKNIFINVSGIFIFSLIFVSLDAYRGYYGPQASFGIGFGYGPGYYGGYYGPYGYPGYYGPPYPYYGVPAPVVYTNSPGAAVALGMTGLLGTALATSGR